MLSLVGSSNTLSSQSSVTTISGIKRIKQRKLSIQQNDVPTTMPSTPSATSVASSQAIDLNSSQKCLKKSLIFKVIFVFPHSS